MEMNQRKMQKYFEDFNVFKHKFFYNPTCEGVKENPDIWESLIKEFHPKGQRYWNVDQAVETFLTMDKVYHYGNVRTAGDNNLLGQIKEKFLGQYVNIEGMEELFQSSYFNFEWMMHLEYQEQKHDYSYYRDHYMHQIRNLYEMFILLDQKELWRACMDIYKNQNNRIAISMKDCVQHQKCRKSEILKRIEDKCKDWNFEEFCYHYIIFATAIVSALVHDIGYPIVFMKRNMSRVHGFLPMSHIFMGMKDSLPKIKSLLNQSLLFSTVGGDEIQKRLEKNDHGAYSAIILLYQYYDNGRIFSLDPVKQMVIELSALVIYNHTLRYAFQGHGKYDRCHNVFTDNPISYLFRLCDDLQEWERVYFLISDRSAFFVCDTCKTPMIRYANAKHIAGGLEGEKIFDYSCFCGIRGWNSLWFSYRKMINVVPFTDLRIAPIEDRKDKWLITLKCDKKALLQLACYNDTFAIQRLQGIQEIRAMVKKQAELPDIFVKAFLTNNPVAIKAKILERFIDFGNIAQGSCNTEMLENYFTNSSSPEKNGQFILEMEKILSPIKAFIQNGSIPEEIYNNLVEKADQHYEGSFVKRADGTKHFGTKETSAIMKESIEFYLYLVLIGRTARKNPAFNKRHLDTSLSVLLEDCDKLAKATARVWNIRNASMIDLLADCFLMMHCDIWDDEAIYDADFFRYQIPYPVRQDICDVVQSYIDERDCLDIYENGNRIGKFNESIFDFYSDYFLYFIMDDCLEKI